MSKKIEDDGFLRNPAHALNAVFLSGYRSVGRELFTETGDKSQGAAGSVAIFPTGNSAMLFHSFPTAKISGVGCIRNPADTATNG